MNGARCGGTGKQDSRILLRKRSKAEKSSNKWEEPQGTIKFNRPVAK